MLIGIFPTEQLISSVAGRSSSAHPLDPRSQLIRDFLLTLYPSNPFFFSVVCHLVSGTVRFWSFMYIALTSSTSTSISTTPFFFGSFIPSIIIITSQPLTFAEWFLTFITYIHGRQYQLSFNLDPDIKLTSLQNVLWHVSRKRRSDNNQKLLCHAEVMSCGLLPTSAHLTFSRSDS